MVFHPKKQRFFFSENTNRHSKTQPFQKATWQFLILKIFIRFNLIVCFWECTLKIQNRFKIQKRFMCINVCNNIFNKENWKQFIQQWESIQQ